MGRVEVIEFEGVRYRRYPDSPRANHRNYFSAAGDYQRKGREPTLHRAIWRSLHGPIPDGHHIHHRDGNPLNNDPDNLVCVSPRDHVAEHWTPERAAAQRAQAERVRPLAAAWHRSEEGRAWHVEHGRRVWEQRESVRRTCEHCGTEFDCITRRSSDRFCSNRCKSAWRRAAGVDDEQRTCVGCGQQFTVNRYSKARSCSRKCAWGVRRREGAGLQPDGLRAA